MAQTPVPLSLKEHLELASELRASGARLRVLCDLVTSVYGPDSRPAFSFARAAEALDRLRHDMQSQATVDLPDGKVDHLYF